VKSKKDAAEFYNRLDNTLQIDYGMRLEYFSNDLEAVTAWLGANHEPEDVEELVCYIKTNAYRVNDNYQEYLGNSGKTVMAVHYEKYSVTIIIYGTGKMIEFSRADLHQDDVELIADALHKQYIHN